MPEFLTKEINAIFGVYQLKTGLSVCIDHYGRSINVRFLYVSVDFQTNCVVYGL